MLATSLPVAQCLERPTGVRKVMGSIPVGDSEFFDMLDIPSLLNSTLLFTPKNKRKVESTSFNRVVKRVQHGVEWKC